MIPFPSLDPVAFSLGPFHIRWYALAYLAGFVVGWRYAFYLVKISPLPRPSRQDVDNFLAWAVLGVILGGRLGYVLFYQPAYYLHHLLEIPTVWKGGMSFHGGLLGIMAAIILFARKNKFSPFLLGDIVAAVGPVGLFLGRIANFINGELYGRMTTMPWGMIFPRGGLTPRHPSQLYEAALEGVTLFTVMAILAHRPSVRKHPGILCGVFLAGYALCRIVVEFFREPDNQIGYLIGGTTLGQLLSLPILVLGIGMIIWAVRRPPFAS